jgi:hypothetical protein
MINLPRAWIVRLDLDAVPRLKARSRGHAEELVFSFALIAFVLWLTLRVLA